MALYADENLPLRVVQELRRLGHDVVTTFEDGKANQSITDRELLNRASELGRAVLMLNRLDFKRLHSASQIMPVLLFAQKILIVSDKQNEWRKLLKRQACCLDS